MAVNLSGFPKPFKPLREPLRSLIGKYEANLIKEHKSTSKTLRWMCDAIEGFFYDHPSTKTPEAILITDVEDWRLARLDAGHAWNSVRRDMCALRSFYSWLIESGREVVCPVVIPPPQKRIPLE